MLDYKNFFASRTVLVNLALAVVGLLILLQLVPLDRQILGIGLIVGGLAGAEFRRRATTRLTKVVNDGVDRINRNR